MLDWLRSTLNWHSDTPPMPATRRKSARTVPWLEPLEDRHLLTVNLLDSFPNGVDALSSNGGGAALNPPRPSIAVGPVDLIETVNQSVAIYNKTTGQQISNTPLATFFQSVEQAGSTFGTPTVLFDEGAGPPGSMNGRFYIAAENTTNVNSQLDLAVSNNVDPTQGYHFFALNNGAGFGISTPPGDPSLGVNNDAILVSQLQNNGFNVFSNTLEFINKSALLSQNQLTSTSLTVSNNQLPLVPADMHGSVAGDPAWFVGEGSGPGASPTVSVVRVTNILGSPTVAGSTSVPVASYTTTSAIQDPGGTIASAVSTAIQDVSYRVVNGTPFLVAAQSVGQTTVTHARWYEFNVTNNAPTLAQSGEINPGAGISTFSPALAIDPAGDLGMTYLQSSASQFVSVFATGRVATDPAGTMQTAVLMQAGSQHANWSSVISGSSGAVDPSNGTFWSVSEFPNTEAAPNWGTSLEHFFVGNLGGDTFFTDGVNHLFLFNNGVFTNTGGFAETFSGGVDAQGNPEVYFTDGNNRLWRWDNGAFTETIGFATRLSAGQGLVAFTDGINQLWTFSDTGGFHNTGGFATIFDTGFDASGNNQIAFLDGNNQLFTFNPSTNVFTNTGGFAISITQGRDPGGNNEIYFLDGLNHIFRLDQGQFTNTGGFALPGTLFGSQGQLFFQDGNNQLDVFDDLGGFTQSGNIARQISSSPGSRLAFFRDANNQLWLFEYGASVNTGGFAVNLAAF